MRTCKENDGLSKMYWRTPEEAKPALHVQADKTIATTKIGGNKQYDRPSRA
jgi:hypothetical protein